ncbi:MAG: bifunctional demethylmenaquinone methyltransferase/2-methoxy-6-polyprenyl-1,4-benzoquinol methylase UbiE [Opitutae bacterium]|nr:bifunctional demethylmenaquinone methyltransferase/2-methoxy-6-polyprenyl-1,4-benzoquinol methylase UbiE [Opitutae bacterium]|tara:strand:- start:1353 stop:2066 length:714 start_codon:yes stop_codon:yes gene_type:complete
MTTPRSEAVERTFAGIAPRYDFANHLLSFGIDYSWRRLLVHSCSASHPDKVLDLATGSGDVAFALERALPKEADVIGLDFCQPMLDQARLKWKDRGSPSNLKFLHGDCLDLSFADGSFDAITMAFGFRNLEDRPRGLSEMLRVLRPGGRLHLLEFSQPFLVIRPFYYFYLRAVLPLFAWLVTGDRKAYQYLGSSIQGFPDRRGLTGELLEAGFGKVSARPLTGAIVALHVAEKKSSD